MPLISFKCVKCDHTQQDIVHAEVEIVKCDKCGETSEKQLSMPSNPPKLNGSGWSK